MIDVKLKDLVLAQVVLDLEGEQHLVELARQRLFLGEKEISRDLHGDRAGTLLDSARGKVGIGCAQYPDVVDAAVLVETVIFSGENGLLHQFGHILDLDQFAALFAEFADQRAFGAEYAQRHFGTIVGQRFQRGQCRVGDYRREDE